MQQEKINSERNTAYQAFCDRKEKELIEEAGDLNKCLDTAFEFWAASWRITSDLSMLEEHACHLNEVYGEIMPEKERLLYKELQQKVTEAYENAELVSSLRKLPMINMMQKVFASGQDGKNFFGAEDVYECLSALWNSGDLIDKLEEFIFVDENAGIGGLEYILLNIARDFAFRYKKV